MEELRLIQDEDISNEEVKRVLRALARNIHKNNRDKGFWENPILQEIDERLEDKGLDPEGKDALRSIRELVLKQMPNGRNQSEAIMLMVTELAEAVEGVRKGKMDDHLPQYTMLTTEINDNLIRLFDFVGGYDLIDEFVDSFIDKNMYNLTRPYKHGKRF